MKKRRFSTQNAEWDKEKVSKEKGKMREKTGFRNGEF
jgi:hypothetical protein